MTHREALVRILRGLYADVDDYRRLRELLQAQFVAALKHSAEEIGAIADRITDLAATLDGRRRERVRLASLILKGDSFRVSIKAVSARLPEASRAAFDSCCATLEGLIEECKRLNRRNCRVIMGQYETMQRVLNTEAVTYAPG